MVTTSLQGSRAMSASKPLFDRRIRKERRQNKRSPRFPFHDDSGTLVSFERRCRTDRRTEGLELTLSDMPKEEFENYFLQHLQEKPNS